MWWLLMGSYILIPVLFCRDTLKGKKPEGETQSQKPYSLYLSLSVVDTDYRDQFENSHRSSFAFWFPFFVKSSTPPKVLPPLSPLSQLSKMSTAAIPSTLKKTIQSIKEITGNHSDEDVYAMLKECSMDPNETAQKLLLQGTCLLLTFSCLFLFSCFGQLGLIWISIVQSCHLQVFFLRVWAGLLLGRC